jgi:carboxymethylenebutenolidase
MYEQDVIVTTKYGPGPSFVACPDGPGPYPGIIFYMDAPGIREELRNMTRRIAGQGYFAILPDMYYRLGNLRFDIPRRDDGMAQVFLAAMRSLTNAMVMDDTAGLLGFLDAQDKCKPGPVGCVGYCMSGQHITNAAAFFPHRIKAAASLYGVGIITDKEDSPHLFLDKIRGELYYAFAETDRSRRTFPATSTSCCRRRTSNTRSRPSRAPSTVSRSPNARSTTRSPPRRPGKRCSRCGIAA